MPANHVIESERRALPTLDGNREWIHWKSRAFPFAAYCLVNETSARLLALLEIYPQVSGAARGVLEGYLLRTSSLLVQSLPAVFEEAFLEALSSAIAIRHSVLEGEGKARLSAQRHLVSMREELCFDEFFRIRKPGGVCEEAANGTKGTSLHGQVSFESEAVEAGLR